MESKTHWFLHVDLDAFFASVEQLDHPEYKGKPVIVGGLPEDKRSVVSTASYEARKFGVHSAMPTFMAYKLCPQGIYVRGRMKRYAELSYQIMSIFKEYSPDVDQMSIDEAFIDITGTEKLFGPPEETAMKIKAHVKRNTGLTVSVGLATTKYLAKIASGFSKPDGFYFVKPGTEQEFMLNLPLEKVWGVGKKTLEALKKSGINSTRDIYDKSFDALEFLYGKNTANFLYNIVRGIDTVNFGHEAKSHSISAERTFVEDITDKYLAETQLMELCQGVVFRLIREESFSRTAFLKIRYEDFSTVSIQETTDRSILTVDSFFEIVKNLFEKKYENGRGIRLLGVGFENIEKEDRPYQQDLFISSDEKKQAVEKAIINLEKKHPEIQIKKARTLNKKTKALLLFLLSSLLFKTPANSYAETSSKTKNTGAGTLLSDSMVEPPFAEGSQALFSYNLGDSDNVEFLVSGFWQANLLSAFNVNFGKNNSFSASLGLPVFTQEVDISTWILLNQKWYFETDFADGFEKNTFAMGYKGDGYLKSARLSNRGITMPAIYSANIFNYGLSGGNNQAPGLSFHFADKGNSRWFGDFIIRYDMTKTNSATFYGKNSTTDYSISPKDFLYGKSFMFPQSISNELTKIDSIYVENKNGKYKDKNGKKYKKLSNSDYTILISSSKLTFAQSALTSKQNDKIPSIIITFTDSSSVPKIIAETGSYTDSQSFAGKIQTFFNTNSQKPLNLSDYSYNLETQIENKTGLMIQNSILFSPYLCANIYDCGLSAQSDLFIQSKSTEKQSLEYTISEITSDISSIPTDFLMENHLYTQISNNNYPDKSLQNPQNRYPFADTIPQIYFNLPYQEDLEIIVRSYSEISDFFIDTNAIAGTVQVYINNKLDYGALYDEETGIVCLSKNVSATDKIYIVWQEDSSDYTGGALSIGSGLFFNILPSLSTDFSITSRWPVFINSKYSTVDSPSYGYTAFSAGITYEKNDLSIKEKAALSINSDNTSGNLFIMEQNANIPQTYYLGNTDGFKTNAQPYLSRFKIQLSEINNCSINSYGGITDSKITGYKIPLQFDFSNKLNELSSPNWASVDIKLENGNELRKASDLEIAILSEISEQFASDVDVYLQLGVEASDSFNGEDLQNIPTWKLNGMEDSKVISALNLESSQWQTILISLTDDDRAKLASGCDARLVIVQKSAGVENASPKGKIYFGPYEPKTQSLFLSYDDSLTVSAYNEQSTQLPSIHKLDLKDCYSTKIKWNVLDEDKASSHSNITGISYFDSADYSSYQFLNIEFAASNAGEISFILSDEEKESVKLILKNVSAYASSEEDLKYHTICINIPQNKVSIDDNLLSQSEYELQINKKIIPDKLTLNIDIQDGQSLFNKGYFYLGNLYYSETSAYFNIQNYVAVNYQKDGTVISINDYDLLKDSFISVESIQSPQSVSASANAGITLTGIRYEADVATDMNAGHKIQTTDSFFKFIHFEESYRFNKPEESLNKSDNIGFDFSQTVIPLTVDFSTDAKDYFHSQTQNIQFDASLQTKISSSSIGISSNYEASQIINNTKINSKLFANNEYFDGWYDISKLEFSTGEAAASSRNQIFTAKLFSEIAPINFSPQLSYILETQYQNLAETTLKDITTLCLEFPFTIKKSNFSIKLSRTGDGSNELLNGGSYISDSQHLLNSMNTKKWIYTSIPFYDILDSNLISKINNSSTILQTASYETMYELGWKRKLTNTISDLFIPSSTNIIFSRNIKGGISQSDLYQIKCTVSNTALNCFGKQSLKPVFYWYNQDEFLSSLVGIVKIPLDQSSSPTFTLSTYQQSLFYISNNSILKTGIDYTIETTLDWQLRTTLIWTRPGKTSILTDLSKRIVKKLDKVHFTISRNEIFNFSIGQQEKLLKQSYEYNHNTDFNFLKYYTVTTGLGTILTFDERTTGSLALTLSVGGKMSF